MKSIVAVEFPTDCRRCSSRPSMPVLFIGGKVIEKANYTTRANRCVKLLVEDGGTLVGVFMKEWDILGPISPRGNLN